MSGMTIEEREYGGGWYKCTRCGTKRPERELAKTEADKSITYSCIDLDWCSSAAGLKAWTTPTDHLGPREKK